MKPHVADNNQKWRQCKELIFPMAFEEIWTEDILILEF